MEVTDWLSKKDKKEVEIIRQNLKKRDRVWFIKKGWWEGGGGGTNTMPK